MSSSWSLGCRYGSGGSSWCRRWAGAGLPVAERGTAGYRDQRLWQACRRTGPGGRLLVAVAGLVGGAAEPVAHGRARPGPRPPRRPPGAVVDIGVGQELRDDAGEDLVEPGRGLPAQ